MYELKIDEKVFDMVDFYEMNTILKKKTIEKSVYYEDLNKQIDEFYYSMFKKMNDESMIKALINYQLLIDRAYEYLISGRGNFEKYFEKSMVKEPEVDKIYKKIISGEKVVKGICFDPMEIAEKMKSVKNDPMDFFYYLSFTVFFLEKYLLNLIVIFPDIFKMKGYKQNSVEELHNYLIKIFSSDYSEGFKVFEWERGGSYEC